MTMTTCKPGAVYYACSKAEAADAVGFADPLRSFYADMSQPAEKRMIAIHHLDAPGKLEPFIIYSKRQQQ